MRSPKSLFVSEFKSTNYDVHTPANSAVLGSNIALVILFLSLAQILPSR